jgi:hypothetical protein
MPENVQYEITSPAENVPTAAPNLRSTLNVSSDGAISTITAVIRKELHEVQASGRPPLDTN